MIDWEREINHNQADIEDTLAKATAKAATFKSIIIVVEEAGDTDEESTVLRFYSSDLTTNEQVGILSRAVNLAIVGNEIDEDGNRRFEVDE